jgi:hypothetical protein
MVEHSPIYAVGERPLSILSQAPEERGNSIVVGRSAGALYSPRTAKGGAICRESCLVSLMSCTSGKIEKLHPPIARNPPRRQGAAQGRPLAPRGLSPDQSQHDVLLHGLVLSIRRSACAMAPGLGPGHRVCTIQESKTATGTFFAGVPRNICILPA